MTIALNPTITQGGLQATFNAQNTGTQLELTHIGFGTGSYDPQGDETSLASEVKRVLISGGARIAPAQIRVSAVWEEPNVECAVTEIGFYAGEVLFAVLSRADGGPYVFKTNESGLLFSYDWTLAAVPAESVTVIVDSNQASLMAMLAAHERNPDAHIQYVKHVELQAALDAFSSQLTPVSLVGPKLIYPDSVSTYTITDYDAFSYYEVTASAGSVVRTGETVTLTLAPEQAPGAMTLDVSRNGRVESFAIAIGEESVGAPVILSPAANESSVAVNPSLSVSAFVAYPDGADTHLSTDWQIATDALFASIVWQSMDDQTNLTSIQVGTGVLAVSTVYYVRVRHNGQLLGGSEWSAITQFTTSGEYVVQPSLTSPVDGVENVALSPVLASSAFATFPAGVDTHLSSRWQVSLDSDFSTIVHDSGALTTKLTSYSLLEVGVKLNRLVTYYARVRHAGSRLGAGAWSPAIQFVTGNQLQGVYTQRNGGATVRSAHTAVEIGGEMYVFGGSDSPAYLNYSARNDLWRYTPGTNTWTQRAAGATARFNHAAVAYNGKMYVAGGVQVSGGSSDGLADAATFYVYDPATNTWALLAAPAAALGAGASLVAVGDKLYAFRQWGGGMWIYTPATNTWTSRTVPSNALGREHSAVVIDGKIIYFGGYNGSVYNNNVYVYDPALDTWTQKASGASKRRAHTAVAIDGKMYVFGGLRESGGVANDLWMYDPLANLWSQLPSGATARADHSAVAIGEHMLLFAGSPTGNYEYTNDLWRVE